MPVRKATTIASRTRTTRVRRTAPAKPDTKDEAVAHITVVPEGRYVAARGRRRESVASVKIWPNVASDGARIIINDIEYSTYFPHFEWRRLVESPLEVAGLLGKVFVLVRTTGGGKVGQAGAVRHGIARALLEIDAGFRPVLRANGHLTRDPRMKERKKYGLKKARRAPQWAKR